MILSTGDIPQPYEIIDVVFAVAGEKAGFLQDAADPTKAFQKVSSVLQHTARSVGADAVINCKFDYRIALGEGFLGKKQVVEFFAYGTAVRILPL